MTDYKKLVIPRKRLPTQPMKLIWPAAVLWLYLDRYHAPAWLIGILGALVGMTFVGLVVQMFREEIRETLFRPEEQRDISGRRFTESWKKNKLSP